MHMLRMLIFVDIQEGIESGTMIYAVAPIEKNLSNIDGDDLDMFNGNLQRLVCSGILRRNNNIKRGKAEVDM